MPLSNDNSKPPNPVRSSLLDQQQRAIRSTLNSTQPCDPLSNSSSSGEHLGVGEVVSAYRSREQNLTAPPGPFTFFQEQELLVPETRGLEQPLAPVFSEVMARFTVDLAHSNEFGAPLISASNPPRFTSEAKPAETSQAIIDSIGSSLAEQCAGLASRFSELFCAEREKYKVSEDALFMRSLAGNRDVFADLQKCLHGLPAATQASARGYQGLQYPVQAYADIFAQLALSCATKDAHRVLSESRFPPALTMFACYFFQTDSLDVYASVFLAVDRCFSDIQSEVFATLSSVNRSWQDLVSVTKTYHATRWRKGQDGQFQSSQPISPLRPARQQYSDFLTDRRASLNTTVEQPQPQKEPGTQQLKSSSAFQNAIPSLTDSSAVHLGQRYGKGMGMNYYELLAAGTSKDIMVLPSMKVEFSVKTTAPVNTPSYQAPPGAPPTDTSGGISSLRTQTHEVINESLRQCDYNFFFMSLLPLLSPRSWAVSPASARAWFCDADDWAVCAQPSVIGDGGTIERISSEFRSALQDNTSLSEDSLANLALQCEIRESEQISALHFVPPQPTPFVLFKSVLSKYAPVLCTEGAVHWSETNKFLQPLHVHPDWSQLPTLQVYSLEAVSPAPIPLHLSLADFHPSTSPYAQALTYRTPVPTHTSAYISQPTDAHLLLKVDSPYFASFKVNKEAWLAAVEEEWSCADALHFFPSRQPVPVLLTVTASTNAATQQPSANTVLPYFTHPLKAMLSFNAPKVYACEAHQPTQLCRSLPQAILTLASQINHNQLVFKKDTGHAMDTRLWFNAFTRTAAVPTRTLSTRIQKSAISATTTLNNQRSNIRSQKARQSTNPQFVAVATPSLENKECLKCSLYSASTVYISGITVLAVTVLNNCPVSRLPDVQHGIPCMHHYKEDQLSPVTQLQTHLDSSFFSLAATPPKTTLSRFVAPRATTIPVPVTQHITDHTSAPEYLSFRGHYSPSELACAAVRGYRPYQAYFPPIRQHTQYGKQERMSRWTKNMDLCSNDHIIIPILRKEHWVLSVVNNASLWKQRYARARLALAVYQQEVQNYQLLTKYWKNIVCLVSSMLGKKMLTNNTELLNTPEVPLALLTAYTDVVDAIKLLYNGECGMIIFDSMTHNITDEDGTTATTVGGTTAPTKPPKLNSLRTGGGGIGGRLHRTANLVCNDNTDNNSNNAVPTDTLSSLPKKASQKRALSVDPTSVSDGRSTRSRMQAKVAIAIKEPVIMRTNSEEEASCMIVDVVVPACNNTNYNQEEDLANKDLETSISLHNSIESNSTHVNEVREGSKLDPATHSVPTTDVDINNKSQTSTDNDLYIVGVETPLRTSPRRTPTSTNRKRVRTLDESSSEETEVVTKVTPTIEPTMDIAHGSVQLNVQQSPEYQDQPTYELPLTDVPFVHNALYNQACVVRPAYLAANDAFSNIATLLDRQWADDRLNSDEIDYDAVVGELYADSRLLQKAKSDLKPHHQAKLSDVEWAFVTKHATRVHSAIVSADAKRVSSFAFEHLISGIFARDRDYIKEDRVHGFTEASAEAALAQATILDPCIHGIIKPFFAVFSVKDRHQQQAGTKDGNRTGSSAPVSPRAPQCPEICSHGCICGTAQIISQQARIAHVYTQAKRDGFVVRTNHALKLIKAKGMIGAAIYDTLRALQKKSVSLHKRVMLQSAMVKAMRMYQTSKSEEVRTDTTILPAGRYDAGAYTELSILSLLPPTSSFQYMPCSYVDVPQQCNPDDCGPLQVTFAKAFLSKPFTLRGGAPMLTKPYVHVAEYFPGVESVKTRVPRAPQIIKIHPKKVPALLGPLSTQEIAAHFRCVVTATVYARIKGPVNHKSVLQLAELIAKEYLALNTGVMHSEKATMLAPEIVTRASKQACPSIKSQTKQEQLLLQYIDMCAMQASLFRHLSPFMVVCKVGPCIITVETGIPSNCSEHKKNSGLYGYMHVYASRHEQPCIQPKMVECIDGVCGLQESHRSYVTIAQRQTPQEPVQFLAAGTLPPMKPLDLYLLKLVHQTIMNSPAGPLGPAATKMSARNIHKAIMYHTVTTKHTIPDLDTHAKQVLDDLGTTMQLIHSYQPFIMDEQLQK